MKQSDTGVPPGSLVDPVAFWTMIGRFIAGQVINVLLVSALMSRSWPSAALFAVVSLVLHRLVVRQYRKLRDERLEALQRLETQANEQGTNP